ncbi:MAG: restriction endonuclease [Actinomycetota bacterium]
MAETNNRRLGEIVQAVFAVLDSSAEPMRARDVIASVKSKLNLSEFEQGSYSSSPESMRFDKILRFSTIGPARAGWLLKKDGLWSLTEDGRTAHRTIRDPEEFMREAGRRYRQWKQSRESIEGDSTDELDTGAEVVDRIDVEVAAEKAWDQIEAYLADMPPYKFQDLVAALLRAMGYFIAWKAEGGKDGGLDILAYSDPLGAAGPRIKVQVKRQAKLKVNVEGLRSFLAILGASDTGVYVSLSGFTSDAGDAARAQDTRRVVLVDGRELVRLWTENVGKIAETDRELLPLRPIFFLDGDE